MRRSTFIRNSSLALVTTGLDPSGIFLSPWKRTSKADSPKKIVIIGAGLAGLVAGYELLQAGHEVTILEARAVPGGRVRTIRAPFADGLYAEVGASRIHTAHQLVKHYAQKFKLSLVPFYPEAIRDVLDVHGHIMPLQNAGKSDYAHYSPRFRHNIEERLHHPVYKLEGGMDLLPGHLAHEIQKHIHYGVPVFKITQNNASVTAYYEQANQLKSIEAEQLICTLPFTVLRNLDIQPALSEDKRKVIFEMPYHDTCRMLFQVRNRYWESSRYNGFAIYPNGEIWHPTFDQEGIRGILAYYPGQYAIRALPPEERLNHVRNLMERFFPGFKEHEEGHFSQYWDEDQYALGAVSNPESLGSLRQLAAIPEGRIHFAGEHTSSYPRWMEGAIESGVKAAAEVIEGK